jgi:hypothetical protein
LHISFGDRETAPQFAQIKALVSFGRGTCFVPVIINTPLIVTL